MLWGSVSSNHAFETNNRRQQFKFISLNPAPEAADEVDGKWSAPGHPLLVACFVICVANQFDFFNCQMLLRKNRPPSLTMHSLLGDVVAMLCVFTYTKNAVV